MPNPPSPFWDSFAFSKTSEHSPESNHEIHQQLAGWLKLTTNGDGQEYLSRLQSRLLPCSLERYDGELMERLQRLFDSSYRRSLFQLLDFGLYYLSNNLLSETQTDHFLTWITTQKHHGLLRSCLEIKTPVVLASATKILESAMRIGDVDLVQGLIHSGIDTSSLKGIYGTKYLLNAAHNGHVIIVRMLLDNGIDVNASVSEKFPDTALQVATKKGHVNMVQVLLEAGAEVNAGNFRDTNYTALWFAIDQDQTKLVRILLNAGANVDKIILRGRSALEYSELYSSPELHQLLAEAGNKDPISISQNGILQAANTGAMDLLQYLTENVENVDSRLFEKLDLALREAAGRFDLNAVRSLLEVGVNPNAEIPPDAELSVLAVAAQSCDVEMVKILLNAGANPNAPGVFVSALNGFCGEKKFEVVELLMKEGLDMKIDGKALLLAAYKNDLKTVQWLLSAGVDVNESGDEYIAVMFFEPGVPTTALQCAVGHIAVLRSLLNAGADVNAPGASGIGQTALQRAALLNETECVRELLRAGADVNAPASSKSSFTALQAAAGQGNIEIMQILLDAGADANASRNEGISLTVLQAALCSATPESKKDELVQILLNAGAKINDPPEARGGRSPIQMAVEVGSVCLVKRLLEKGADVNTAACLENGRTAIQVACSAEEPDMELIEILLNAGADIHAPAGFVGGLTALQGAAIRGYMRIALKLLELGADVNAAPAEVHGRMALDGAAENGRLDMVHMLLNAGAMSKGCVKDSYRRAIKLATRNGHFTLARLLEDRDRDNPGQNNASMDLLGPSRPRLPRSMSPITETSPPDDDG